MSTLVHLIYIHGFQGNDTTFQSFPKHLQEHLEAKLSKDLNITVQSSLYPTYKSVKPISHATKNFLEWLSTQPPGPVILLGHSMGGLLAADAATDPSNNPGGKPKRIVGVMAFDTPYLGMHPHVVVTGIASLLPKNDDPEKKGKSESSMNQHPQVKVVDQEVTDDWETFKKQADVHLKNAPISDSKRSSFTHLSNRSQDSARSVTSSNLAPSGAQSSSSSFSESPSFMERAFAYVGAKDDDPMVRWLRKHADDPLSAGKRWIVERFQFGICMFDPPGLKSRYLRLVEWGSAGGVWVNYWTTTVTHARHHGNLAHEDSHEILDNDQSLVANGVIEMPDNNPSLPTRPSSEAKDIQEGSNHRSKDIQQFWKHKQSKEKDQKTTKSKKERHFVVLPNGLGEVLGGMEKWENIPIGGVRDEVNAHTGLFIPQQNLNYESFVETVGLRILQWCEPLHQPQTAR